MRLEDITDVYYANAKNSDGIIETPHITNKEGQKTYFEIRCRVCNKGLCKLVTIARSPKKRQNMIFVEPCPICSGKKDKEIKLDGDWKSNRKEDVA